MHELSYPWEKFSTAVLSLVGGGPLRKRIESAYLSFHPLRSSDFAKFPELRAEFDKLMTMLTSVKARGDEGHVNATLSAASDEQLEKIADQITGVCFAIARELRQ